MVNILNHIILSIFFLTFMGCNRNQETQPVQSENPLKVPEKLYGASLNGVLLPDGSSTKVSTGKVEIIFPQGVKWISKNNNGSFSYFDSACYECTSTCTDGCNVIYYNGSFGCSECKNGASCTGKKCDGGGISTDGLFLDFNKDITIIPLKEKKNISKMYPNASFLFDIPQVQKSLLAFNKKIYGSENPSESDIKNTQTVILNVFGVAIGYKIPKKFNLSKIMEDDPIVIDDDEKKISCSCQSGSSGCTKNTGILATTCISGDCTTCSMTVN